MVNNHSLELSIHPTGSKSNLQPDVVRSLYKSQSLDQLSLHTSTAKSNLQPDVVRSLYKPQSLDQLSLHTSTAENNRQDSGPPKSSDSLAPFGLQKELQHISSPLPTEQYDPSSSQMLKLSNLQAFDSPTESDALGLPSLGLRVQKARSTTGKIGLEKTTPTPLVEPASIREPSRPTSPKEIQTPLEQDIADITPYPQQLQTPEVVRQDSFSFNPTKPLTEDLNDYKAMSIEELKQHLPPGAEISIHQALIKAKLYISDTELEPIYRRALQDIQILNNNIVKEINYRAMPLNELKNTVPDDVKKLVKNLRISEDNTEAGMYLEALRNAYKIYTSIQQDGTEADFREQKANLLKLAPEVSRLYGLAFPRHEIIDLQANRWQDQREADLASATWSGQLYKYAALTNKELRWLQTRVGFLAFTSVQAGVGTIFASTTANPEHFVWQSYIANLVGYGIDNIVYANLLKLNPVNQVLSIGAWQGITTLFVKYIPGR